MRPKIGFNDTVIKELGKKTASFTEEGKFVVISFDEINSRRDCLGQKYK